jgi:hypothetical protein
MTEETPVPAFAPAFALTIERGAPVEVGALAIGGRRVHAPVTGGTVTGELAGELVGGSETMFERADGVTVVEASYYLRDASGAAARIVGQGYRTAEHTRLSLMVEAAADGPLAPFSAAVFVGEALPGAARLTVQRVI